MFTVLLAQAVPAASRVQANLGWSPPGIGGILSFIIRFFFVIAGLAALFMMMTGALAWVTSGGSKENVEKAREKIISSVVGVLMIVIVLSVAATLERVVFNCHICFGLTCDITIPSIINPKQVPAGCNGTVIGVGGGPGDALASPSSETVPPPTSTPTPTFTPTPSETPSPSASPEESGSPTTDGPAILPETGGGQ